MTRREHAGLTLDPMTFDLFNDAEPDRTWREPLCAGAVVLRRFALANPRAAKGMHVNPFADRFEVVPRTHGSVFTIVGDFATRGGPITNVKPSDLCALGAG